MLRLTGKSDLYLQIAPKGFAAAACKMEELRGKLNLKPAFRNSVFTTCEISYNDAPRVAWSRKNFDSVFFGMEAFTVCGSWDPSRGVCVFWEDEGIISLHHGTTVIFPAGTKRWSFGALKAHEHMYVFHQFFHAGVWRWLEKGGRSDAEFARDASNDELAAWNAKCAARGESTLKLYSKLRDIYVFS